MPQTPSAQQPQSLPQHYSRSRRLSRSSSRSPSRRHRPPQQAQSFAQPPSPQSAALGQQQFPGTAQLSQPTQFSQPAAAPAAGSACPAHVGFAVALPLADAGTTTANTGGVNLGLPLSGQAPAAAAPLTSPLAAPPLLTPEPAAERRPASVGTRAAGPRARAAGRTVPVGRPVAACRRPRARSAG